MKAILPLAAIAVAYLCLTQAQIRTRRPLPDESWYGTPGYNLLAKGYMGISVLDPTSSTWKGVRLDGIDRHVYLNMPLHFLATAVWYKLFGFSLFSLRTLSSLWGLAALFCWYGIVLAISGERPAALFAVTLLAFDYLYVWHAADGRMDMMSVALASAAVLVYLRGRGRTFARALFAGCCLAVAAGFTHINGGVLAVTGLAAFVLCEDWRLLRLWHVALPAIPLLAGGFLWMLYALRDLPAFWAQLGSTSTGRLAGLSSPFQSPWKEIAVRYLPDFGFGSWNRGSAHIYILMPLAYVAALAGGFAVASFRRYGGHLALLVWTSANLCYYVFLDALKNEAYITYMVPLWTVLLALAIDWCWARRLLPRPIVAAAVAGLLLIQLVRDVRPIEVDSYRTSYLPAIAFLAGHTTPATTITGSAELGFGLGFRDSLYDDIWMGCRNGRRTDLIVINENYRGSMQDFRTSAPDVAACQEDLLKNRYHAVYDYNGYTVYARNEMR